MGYQTCCFFQLSSPSSTTPRAKLPNDPTTGGLLNSYYHIVPVPPLIDWYVALVSQTANGPENTFAGMIHAPFPPEPQPAQDPGRWEGRRR